MRPWMATTLLGVLVCSGCASRDTEVAPASSAAAAAEAASTTGSASSAEKEDALKLDAQAIADAGIRTVHAAPTNRAVEITGYGIVLPHDTIAQSVAELKQAEAVAAQSRAALARAEHLKGTPGAMSADQVETALRQSAVDASGAELARQKLSAVIGRPMMDRRALEGLLQRVADGERKILRATFAASEPPIAPGARIQAIRLGTHESQPIESLGPAWPAPADPEVPGRSYFTVMPGDSLAEGERVTTIASSGDSLTGLFVPGAAVVLFDARPWFYVEHPGGAFQRLPIDAERHVEGGYTLNTSLGSEDRIVVEGAAILLAKEQGAAEPD